MSSAPGLVSGLQILEYVSSRPQGIGFNELKSLLELQSASLSRYVKVLYEEGYLEKNEAQLYVPGYRLLRMNQSQEAWLPALTEITGPVLQSITAQTAMSSLWIGYSQGRMVCVDRALAPEGVVLQEPGTVRTDYHVQPWAYLYLSGLSPEKRRVLLDNSVLSLPSWTVPDAESLVRRINDAGLLGYSDDGGDIVPGYRRLAVPVHKQGKLIGAIGVGFINGQLGEADIQAAISLMQEKAAGISNMWEASKVHNHETSEE